jgi:predicted dehydrogenase
MRSVSIIGCGFVADLYMRSFAQYSDVTVTVAYDQDDERAAAFGRHWDVATVNSLEEFLNAIPDDCLVLNLTNPKAHYEINTAVLTAGFSVYSEKPLAMSMDEARALYELAQTKGLLLASAPCSLLGESAQVLGKAIRDNVAGSIRLIYAELDDGFIPQAPYKDWISESGAPWPAEDEFQVGCTLEHAGYYLGWLIGHFGSIRKVVAASAEVLPDKASSGTPDFSVATLFFESGLVARLTCSIVAPHDHRIRLIGDKGVLEVKQAWDNTAPVRFFRRMRVRRRLLELPFGRRLQRPKSSHAKVGRWGAASMNFALGPLEMLDAQAESRVCRLSADFALHMNEVTLAIQNARESGAAYETTTRCDPVAPMPWVT